MTSLYVSDCVNSYSDLADGFKDRKLACAHCQQTCHANFEDKMNPVQCSATLPSGSTQPDCPLPGIPLADPGQPSASQVLAPSPSVSSSAPALVPMTLNRKAAYDPKSMKTLQILFGVFGVLIIALILILLLRA